MPRSSLLSSSLWPFGHVRPIDRDILGHASNRRATIDIVNSPDQQYELAPPDGLPSPDKHLVLLRGGCSQGVWTPGAKRVKPQDKAFVLQTRVGQEQSEKPSCCLPLIRAQHVLEMFGRTRAALLMLCDIGPIKSIPGRSWRAKRVHQRRAQCFLAGTRKVAAICSTEQLQRSARQSIALTSTTTLSASNISIPAAPYQQ